MTKGGAARRNSLTLNDLHPLKGDVAVEVDLERLRVPPIQPLLARPRGIAIPQFGVDLREQILHLLRVGVELPPAWAVLQRVD